MVGGKLNANNTTTKQTNMQAHAGNCLLEKLEKCEL